MGGGLMRFRKLLTNTSLFFPRVRRISYDELIFLYRWCFTDAEIFELSRENRLLEIQGISSRVVFRYDPKAHRRREYTALLRNDGWLRVALALPGDTSEGAYLLYSVFNDSGESYDFAQIDAFFDFLQFRCPLDLLRDDVKQRLDTDIQRHYEISKEHFKHKIGNAEKLNTADQESALDWINNAARKRLDDIRKGLRDAKDPSERDKLLKLRHDIRNLLLEVDKREIESIRRALNTERNAQLRVVTLFTLEWSVQETK
jgi:hypothetical protein